MVERTLVSERLVRTSVEIMGIHWHDMNPWYLISTVFEKKISPLFNFKIYLTGGPVGFTLIIMISLAVAEINVCKHLNPWEWNPQGWKVTENLNLQWQKISNKCKVTVICNDIIMLCMANTIKIWQNNFVVTSQIMFVCVSMENQMKKIMCLKPFRSWRFVFI